MKNLNKTILTSLLIALSLISISCSGSQSNTQQREIKFNPSVKYYEDYLDFASTEAGKTRVDVFIQVPYSEIQFVKSPTGFESKYYLTVSVFDEDKENLILEKSWNEKIFAKEFDQTVSKTNHNLSLRSFNLEPGKYLLRTSFEDVDSHKEYVTEKVINVRKLEPDFAMSDMMLISKQTVVEGTSKIIPNVSRNVAVKKDGLPFFFEVYSNSAREIKIEYTITENGKETAYREEVNRQIDTGRTQIFHTIENVDLGLGDYMLGVNIQDDKNDVKISALKGFVSRWVGVPSSIKDLDKAIAQMIYIATGSELAEIQGAKTQEEKIRKYLDYWKKKDPNPESEDNPVFDEYYRRVAFANENFSHYVEGWRTDRGMVFIILGAPNNIDRHPFEYDSKPYEVWEYYELNKSFVFLDETGFGDYRLITPLYGDYFRYRY